MSSTTAVSASTTTSAPTGGREVDRGNRGIPKATFIEDVVLAVSQTNADALLAQLQALYGKYKFMESHLVQQQKGMLIKIPDISNALSALHHLMKNQEKVSCHFELADSLYANATLAKEDKVLLWLGANVMLEYSYAEADELLTKNLRNAEVNLASLESDLAFLKDQITISEVNIARIHNYNVQLKKEAKEANQTQGQQISKAGRIQAAGTIPGPL